ncbi:MAG: hypothetical protein DBX44_03830 [Oscillospiraceae bacterium]|nr:MAG: hypothetical protein DBX44_03830 [Oscillospiraceae bacterium]
MKLPVIAPLRRADRTSNSRSMLLRILTPRRRAAFGPADGAGCALVSALLLLGCGGSLLRLFAVP